MLVIKQFGPVTYAMGTLQEILAGTGIAAKVRALPNDVAGCTLEMGTDGKWVGTLGSLPKATADALYASGALANLATGATYRDTSGTQYTYSAGVGWQEITYASKSGTYSMSLALRGSVPFSSVFSSAEEKKTKTPYIGMRIHIFNAGASMPITACKVASAPTALHNGSGLTWKPVTFGGASTVTIGAGTAENPTRLISDYIALPSVDRMDIPGAPYIAHVRTCATAGAYTMLNAKMDKYYASSGDLSGVCNATASDIVSTPSSFALSEAAAHLTLCIAEFISIPSLAKKTCIVTGDSRSTGAFSDSDAYGIAISMYRYGGIPTFACGKGGRTTTQTRNDLDLVLSSGTRASHCLVWFESPNDGFLESNYSAAFANGVYMAEKLRSLGIMPICINSTPRNASDDWVIRKQYADLAIAFAKQNKFIAVDMLSASNDPANPWNWRDEYKPVDVSNYHGNEAWNTMAGKLIASAMQ